MNRRVKIVCTIGPASRSPEVLHSLIEAGLDVARFNFSHGTHEDHAENARRVRAAAAAAGRNVAILADLQGPRIRLGAFAGGRAQLETGREFVLTGAQTVGTAERASTTYAALAEDARPGDTILIDDGRIRLEAIARDGLELRTRVIEGGPVSDHKGMNLPGVRVSVPSFTAKDAADLEAALAMPVDLVALSFVRSPEDVDPVRAAMARRGVTLPLIAKIEKPEAVPRLEPITRAFDGLMVARGDLGVELPLEEVPLVQKRAIRLGRDHAKPVIVATQMLDSMIQHARPTRAEVSDVANAVFDGADALMLSGETGIGAHPLQAVETMARVIVAAEREAGYPALAHDEAPIQDAIAAAAVEVAHRVQALALVAFTSSGATARRIASHRPRMPVFAFTTEAAVQNQLALTWGVEAMVMAPVQGTDRMVSEVTRALLDQRRGAAGDRVVLVGGTPPGVVGSTNTVRVHLL